MDERQALMSLAALSQETRLAVVRNLVVAGPEGMAAGVIAEKMNVSPSNISFHLKELERSGLIAQRRESRSILYSANYEALSSLVLDEEAEQEARRLPTHLCASEGGPARHLWRGLRRRHSS